MHKANLLLLLPRTRTIRTLEVKTNIFQHQIRPHSRICGALMNMCTHIYAHGSMGKQTIGMSRMRTNAHACMRALVCVYARNRATWYSSTRIHRACARMRARVLHARVHAPDVGQARTYTVHARAYTCTMAHTHAHTFGMRACVHAHYIKPNSSLHQAQFSGLM